jgi:hypothetical protein
MHMIKLFATLAVITIPLTIGARAAGPGSCGEYMYWKAGQCVDAHAPPLSWAEQMGRKTTW